MKNASLLLCCTLLSVFLVYSTAFAEIKISGAWVRATPPNLRVTAGYMTIANSNRESDALIAVSSPWAETIEIHETRQSQGMATMDRLNLVEIPGQNEVTLKPMGKHLMIMGLKKALREGQQLPLVLRFKNKGSIQLQMPIKK